VSDDGVPPRVPAIAFFGAPAEPSARCERVKQPSVTA